MSNSEQANLDVNVSSDATKATLQQLIDMAEAADASFRKLKQSALDAINVTGGKNGAGVPIQAQTLAQAQQLATQLGAHANTVAPGLTQALQQAQARQKQIAQSVGQFAASQGQSLAGQTPQQMFQAYVQQSRPASVPPVGAAAQGGAYTNPYKYQYGPAQPTYYQSRSPLGPAVPSGFTPAPSTTSLTQSLGQALSQGMTLALNRARQAVGGGIAGDALSLVAGLGPIGAGAAGTVGAALALNATQASQSRAQAALATNQVVGTPMSWALQSAQLSAINATGSGFGMGPSDAQDLAKRLAASGAPDLVNNLMSSLMLSGPNQLPGQDIVDITGRLATGGGMSSTQINKTYQDLANIATDANLPLGQLVTSMKVLSQTATGAAKNVASLAGVQSVLGASSGINAGQVLSPSLSSIGGMSIVQQHILGMSESQFAAAQQDPAQMFDAIGQLARKYDKGSNGTQITESVLQSMGLMDFSGLNPTQASALVQSLVSGKPGQAEALARQYGATAAGQRLSSSDAVNRASNTVSGQTSLINQTLIGGQDFLQWAGSAASGIMGGNAGTDQEWRELRRNNPDIWSALQSSSGGTLTPDQMATLKNTAPDLYSAYLRYQRTGTKGATQGGAAGGSTSGSQGYSALGGDGSASVPNTRGSRDLVSGGIFGLYQNASNKTGVPLPILLAMGARESDFDPNAREANGNGRGIAQFDLSLNKQGGEAGSNLANSAKYLGVRLSGNAGQDFQAVQAAAMDPARAISGQAAYLKALYATHGNDWQSALTGYNGDPAYGASVFGASGEVTVNFTGIIKDQNGNTLGTVVPGRTTVTPKKPAGHVTHTTK